MKEKRSREDEREERREEEKGEEMKRDRDERREIEMTEEMILLNNVSKPKIRQTTCLIMILKNPRRTNRSFEGSESYPCFHLFT